MFDLARDSRDRVSDDFAVKSQSRDRSSHVIVRLLQANRVVYDGSSVPFGAGARRVVALETALAEANLLQRRLTAIEASTTWRLTRPIRWAISLLRGPTIPAVSASATEPEEEPWSYQRWIEACEPAWLAALAGAKPGMRKVLQQRVGLVLLPHADALESLERLQLCCPAGCEILVLDATQDPRLATAAREGTRVHRVAAGFTASDAAGIALRELDCDLLGFLDPRDTPAPMALDLLVKFAAAHPECDVLYGDEDWLEADGRTRPFFKPGWDSEWQRSRDLLGPFVFLRAGLVRQAVPSPGAAWLYDLANQVAAAAQPTQIFHIPAVLCHRRAALPPAELMQAAAQAQLRREGVAAQVKLLPGGGQRIAYRLPSLQPLVSVIVPTRDHAELLSVCADALLHRTDYKRLELIIIDNGTAADDALALLDQLATDPRVEILREPGPFNWSKLNNIGAGKARGDVLLLLNNDIDVLDPDWLSVLVSHAIQPGTGAVGPKMLYPDGRVQHAGLTVDGDGVPRHLFRFAPGESPGAFEMMAAAREVWAVTGACIAISREVFWAVGGLNEALPVTYNDVDLCLRLAACGYRTVWTPWSVLEHRELGSRLPDHLPEQESRAREELDRLLRDWGPLALHDPYINPSLDLRDEQLRYGPLQPTPPL